MRRLAPELIFSLLAILAITALYGLAARREALPPGSLAGHMLGIVGFLLMLCTEILYTMRKRLRRFTAGPMRTWLQFHIFTGIVGPYLVLLHSAGKFRGLAGVVTLVTLLMVLSGFIGRYIYTAAPRTLDGIEVGAAELEEQTARAGRELQALAADLGPAAPLALASEALPGGWMLVLGRPVLLWRQRRRLRRTMRELNLEGHPQASRFRQLLEERYRLRIQIQSLAATRRLLALWHLFHIPLGAALFSLAFIHIGAALYYSTFLK